MAVRFLDEVNLQKMGMSIRNISALRNAIEVVLGSSLNTSDIEKLTLGGSSEVDSLRERLNQLERLILLASSPETEQKDDNLQLLITSFNGRIDELENKLSNIEDLLWLLTSP